MKTQMENAVAALKEGGVLLVPTETVYGLVCDWENASARDRIYAMKHRAENKPLGVFVPDVECAEKLCGCVLPSAAKKLAAAFMPGPLTLVVPDSGGSTFGFRIPDHPFLLELLKRYGRALAQTSANRSGQPPALDVSYALKTLAEAPALVVDGGVLPHDSEASTVVLVRADNSVAVLRGGILTGEQIQQTVGEN